MHEWRPIDTAPKDRHLLLGYKVENGRERYGEVVFGYFDEHLLLWKELIYGRVMKIQPTHWQFIPSWDEIPGHDDGRYSKNTMRA